jgi:Restriction endonuclease NotI
MTKIVELYGVSTQLTGVDWQHVVRQESCPYLERRCTKTRKSDATLTIGTCSMLYGKEQKEIIICPFRFLERQQIFTDCLHLLTTHEPGNELHIIPEVGIPGGSVDYFLVSVRNREIRDFVGIELQALDTTGTIWPDRQRFLQTQGFKIEDTAAIDSAKTFGMNWKMTAKTILIQLHHKVQTFQEINKHLVLVIQDHFMDYIRKGFSFDHLQEARLGDSAHFHVYKLHQAYQQGAFRLELDTRFSTDADGIARSLGLQTNPKLELEEILRKLRAKLSENTRFRIGG